MLEAHIYMVRAMSSLFLSAFEGFSAKGRRRVLSVAGKSRIIMHLHSRSWHWCPKHQPC